MKVAVIGAGNVGASIAYTLALLGTAPVVSLIDANADKAAGEALDIAHGVSLGPHVTVIQEDWDGLKDADIIVHAAGRGRRANETRLDLARGNVQITEAICDNIKQHYNGRSIVVVVANPMDVLTYVVYKKLGIPASKVIGSGTVLDSSRFKYVLAKRFNIDPRNVHAKMIGEHGDSAVCLWSTATMADALINTYPSPEAPALSAEDKVAIREEVIAAGREVIRRKGATFYAIAMSVNRIIRAIAEDENHVLPVSSYIDGLYGIHDVCLSLPSIVTREGIKEIFPITLTAEETQQLQASADVLKGMLKELGYQA